MALLDKLLGGAVDNPVVNTAMIPFNAENKYVSRPLASAALSAFAGAAYPFEQLPEVGDDVRSGRQAANPFLRFGLESTLAPSNFIPMATPLKAFRIGRAAVRGYKGADRLNDILRESKAAQDTFKTLSKRSWTKPPGKRLKGEAVKSPQFMLRKGGDNPLVIRYFYADTEVPMNQYHKVKGVKGHTFSPRRDQETFYSEGLEAAAERGDIKRLPTTGKLHPPMADTELKLPGVYLDSSPAARARKSGPESGGDYTGEFPTQFIKAKRPLRLLDVATKDGKRVWHTVTNEAFKSKTRDVRGVSMSDVTSSDVRDLLVKRGYDGTLNGGTVNQAGFGDYNRGEVLIFDPSLLEIVGKKDVPEYLDLENWLTDGFAPRNIESMAENIDTPLLKQRKSDAYQTGADPVKQRFTNLADQQAALDPQVTGNLRKIPNMGRGNVKGFMPMDANMPERGFEMMNTLASDADIESLTKQIEAIKVGIARMPLDHPNRPALLEKGIELNKQRRELLSLRDIDIEDGNYLPEVGAIKERGWMNNLTPEVASQMARGGQGGVKGALSAAGRQAKDEFIPESLRSRFTPDEEPLDPAVEEFLNAGRFNGPTPRENFGVSQVPNAEGTAPHTTEWRDAIDIGAVGSVGSPEEYQRIIQLQQKPIEELTEDETLFLIREGQKDIESLLSASGMDAEQIANIQDAHFRGANKELSGRHRSLDEDIIEHLNEIDVHAQIRNEKIGMSSEQGPPPERHATPPSGRTDAISKSRTGYGEMVNARREVENPLLDVSFAGGKAEGRVPPKEFVGLEEPGMPTTSRAELYKYLRARQNSLFERYRTLNISESRHSQRPIGELTMRAYANDIAESADALGLRDVIERIEKSNNLDELDALSDMVRNDWDWENITVGTYDDAEAIDILMELIMRRKQRLARMDKGGVVIPPQMRY